ncbi:hypothetical protein MPL1032_60057 [Mesorhizobium plurifarium]|uniref:Uncharacterized protein n=1 Tax=Mesorhizobium plurifarium TaxID=69974 RepID=A0A0K2W604_MESPL|nr:hypothetical protein MPL1032_60057 [Mesorhizobium plurifarium]
MPRPRPEPRRAADPPHPPTTAGRLQPQAALHEDNTRRYYSGTESSNFALPYFVHMVATWVFDCGLGPPREACATVGFV